MISPSSDLLNHQGLTQQILIIKGYTWIISLSPFIITAEILIYFTRYFKYNVWKRPTVKYLVKIQGQCAVRQAQTEFDWDISPFLRSKFSYSYDFTRFFSKYKPWKCQSLYKHSRQNVSEKADFAPSVKLKRNLIETFRHFFGLNCTLKRRPVGMRIAQWSLGPNLLWSWIWFDEKISKILPYPKMKFLKNVSWNQNCKVELEGIIEKLEHLGWKLLTFEWFKVFACRKITSLPLKKKKIQHAAF